jgi:hypothetical protein
MYKNKHAIWSIKQILRTFLPNHSSLICYAQRMTHKTLHFLKRVWSVLCTFCMHLFSHMPEDVSGKLPLEFNGELYWKLNPDLEKAGIDPAKHYYKYGQHEGRRYALPKTLHFLPGDISYATKKNILLVSHNASMTDALVLALNIARSLSARYNVIVLLLGGGALVEAFQSTSAGVVLEPIVSNAYTDRIVSILCTQYVFLFALVNTIESRKVLPTLVSHFVPIVSVLPELESNMIPWDAFEEVCGLSTETVFSTQLALDNFSPNPATSPYFSLQVIPPGKCVLPRKDISAGKQYKTAAITPHMEEYVARLEDVALSAQHKIQQDKADMEEILNAGDFQSMFSTLPHLQDLSDIEAIKIYFRDWKKGRDPPKPFPGFHPGIYRMLHGTSNNRTDPFADYLRQGEPEGPWHFPMIRPLSDHVENDINVSKRMGKVALHLHVYYPDMFFELLQRLTLNTARPDLFISVPDTAAQEEVKQALIGYTGTIADIQVMPNQGRDIGSLLTGFGKVLTENYDIVGHLHTKKSLYASDRELISRWKNLLLENLLGGEKGGHMADSILTTMLHDPTISIVFPEDPYAMGWGTNRAIAAKQFASRLGLSVLPEAFNFPVGTMFWMRTPLLKRFVDLDISWEDYPPEPLPTDGSMLHALERLFGVVADSDPFRIAVTHVPGVGR